MVADREQFRPDFRLSSRQDKTLIGCIDIYWLIILGFLIVTISHLSVLFLDITTGCFTTASVTPCTFATVPLAAFQLGVEDQISSTCSFDFPTFHEHVTFSIDGFVHAVTCQLNWWIKSTFTIGTNWLCIFICELISSMIYQSWFADGIKILNFLWNGTMSV